MTEADMRCDVLIAGAGPTGAALALFLARQGVDVLVIDREADIYPLPRAAHVDHEAMRIFQALGVADAVMATSRPVPRYDFLNAAGEVLLRFDRTDRVGAGGWPVSNMIHQPSIERILRDALTTAPSAVLLTRHRLDAFEEVADGVRARVEGPDGPLDVTARFLVGADGARSAVRSLAGIGLDDLCFDEPWLVVDAIVHDAARLPSVNLQICDPQRPTTCVLMGSGRHRWEFMLKPGETAEQVLEDAFVARLLAPWKVDGAVSIERKAVYRFNARVAERWRQGRALLAGDAAHQMPPFAGQGLCSGLRDAANLAWKLSAVLNDGADDVLLDCYQPEREPNVRGIIALAMMMGRTVCMLDPEAAAARDANMIAARSAGMGPDGNPGFPDISAGCIVAGAPAAGACFPQFIAANGQRLDDVLGPGAWLLCRTATGVVVSDDVRVATVDDLDGFQPMLAHWLDRHDAEAVLVRPDRSVFGTGRAAAMLAAYKGWTTGLFRKPHRPRRWAGAVP